MKPLGDGLLYIYVTNSSVLSHTRIFPAQSGNPFSVVVLWLSLLPSSPGPVQFPYYSKSESLPQVFWRRKL